MRKLILAVALAALPVTGFAQSDDMGQGLTMLEEGAKRTLAEFGVEADVMTLTLSQLAEIKTIAEGGDMTSGKARIEAAIAREDVQE